MTDNKDFYPQLLPIGLSDLLPPEAAVEEALLRKIGDYLTASDYERVKPPLLEFANDSASDKSFRVADPLSQDSDLLALRTDMTVQVARIATERLVGRARPLRLFYSGEVLRVKGSQLRPKRQFLQIGAEIIGSGGHVAATQEILLLAAESLRQALGKRSDAISFDLSLPLLVGELLSGASADEREALGSALQVRDSAYLRRHKFKHAKILADLVDAGGEYKQAIRALDKVKWPKSSQPLYKRLKTVASAVRAEMPEIRLTVDIVENQGFDYQSGLSFTIYAEGAKGALGRGGEYPAGATAEAACGFSLYMDSLLRIADGRQKKKRVLAACGTGMDELRAHRKGGVSVVVDWQAKTVEALDKKARSDGFSHILIGGKLSAVKGA